MSKYNDYPFDDVVKAATVFINCGVDVHQKFTCAKCGSRQTMETSNVFYKTGECEECKHITDIYKNGCNYMLNGKPDDIIQARKILEGSK